MLQLWLHLAHKLEIITIMAPVKSTGFLLFSTNEIPDFFNTFIIIFKTKILLSHIV